MKVSILIMLVGVLFFAVPRPCQAAAGPATDTVRRMLDDVMSIQTDPHTVGEQSREARRDAIQKVIVREFDFPDMAREALGPQWEKLSAADRTEFRAVFQDLFLDSYSRLVLDFLKKERIVYTAEGAQGDKTVVKTSIYRVNEQIPVDYSLAEAGGKWVVQDVTIDGVSIVGNYRNAC